jgi:ABC-2 type transport system ATP-binding protein
MSDQAEPNILTVDSLNINYGEFQAVKDVSFSVLKGEIFGLLGPNGAGKTSTLSAIEGLLRPISGTINVDGFNANEKPAFNRSYSLSRYCNCMQVSMD